MRNKTVQGRACKTVDTARCTSTCACHSTYQFARKQSRLNVKEFQSGVLHPQLIDCSIPQAAYIFVQQVCVMTQASPDMQVYMYVCTHVYNTHHVTKGVVL